MAKLVWAGQACFQISLAPAKDVSVSIVIDPFEEKIGLKMPAFDADIVLVTHNHYDHNNVKALKGASLVIESPGEYESKGVFVQGIDSWHDDAQGKERGRNTIYTIEAEGIRFCHLGDFGQKELTEDQLEKIGTVDVLMIPVGGNYTINASQATKIIGQSEPKMVIPMHYKLPKLEVELDGVEMFLKAMGKNSVEAQDKIIIKQSTLPKEGAMEIIVLKP